MGYYICRKVVLTLSFSIGGKLKELRLKSEKNKAEFARLLGLPYTTYNNYETGNREPNFDTINSISQILGLEMSELLSAPFSNPEQRAHENKIFFLEQKLTQIGYNISGLESEGCLWIDYPDGALEVTEDILKALDEESSAYLKFKLEELKEKNIKDFKKK